MTKIDATGLRAGTYKLMYYLISGNVADPSSRGKRWIYADFPETTSDRFNGYPIIIIDRPKVGTENESFTTHGNGRKKSPIAMTVRCIATDTPTSENLADSFSNLFRSSGNIMALKASGLNNIDLPEGNPDQYFRDNVKLYVNEVPLICTYTEEL